MNDQNRGHTVLLTALASTPRRVVYDATEISYSGPAELILNDALIYGVNKVPFEPGAKNSRTFSTGVNRQTGARDNWVEDDGVRVSFDPALELKRVCQSRVTVPAANAITDSLPVFVSQDPELSPMRVGIVCRLNLSTVGAIPDTQLYLAKQEMVSRRRDAERVARGLPVSPMLSESINQLAQLAQNQQIEAGMFLSIEVQGVLGALELESRVADNTWEATLHLTRQLQPLNAGAVLSRQVEWNVEGQTESKAAQIGFILQAGVAQK